MNRLPPGIVNRLGVYLIAACLPCYRPLIKVALGRGQISAGSGYNPRSSMVTPGNWTPNHLHRIHSTDQDVEMGTYLSPKWDLSPESDEQTLLTKITVLPR